MESGYYCEECGRPVIVKGETIIRACKHTCKIIVNMSAIATGDSKVKQG